MVSQKKVPDSESGLGVSAIGAETVDFQLVTSDHEAMQGGDFILQFLYGFVLELDYAVASGTDQVVMVFTGHHMLITGLAVMQQYLARQAGLHKQLQRTVDRGVADAGIAGFDLQIEFFNTDMLVGRKENVENHIPLAGGAQPFAGGETVEGFFLFQYHAPPLIELDIQFNDRDCSCQLIFCSDPARSDYSYISRIPPRALFNVPSNFSSTPPLRISR